ncbi:hypothetical protein PUN28_006519 [Cardiocondyla obscurior]|uniref:Uncharacterized protein n=1 Tax=Cardiocondyla obscurior TaxID=286306 RepID=A0AAW2GBK6_9HYME
MPPAGISYSLRTRLCNGPYNRQGRLPTCHITLYFNLWKSSYSSFSYLLSPRFIETETSVAESLCSYVYEYLRSSIPYYLAERVNSRGRVSLTSASISTMLETTEVVARASRKLIIADSTRLLNHLCYSTFYYAPSST